MERLADRRTEKHADGGLERQRGERTDGRLEGQKTDRWADIVLNRPA